MKSGNVSLMDATASAKRLASGPKFELGRVVATANCLHTMEEKYGGEGVTLMLTLMLRRHQHGDWGNVDPQDGVENERSLRDSGRLMSIYLIDDDFKVWIITEWDRSATTIMLPEDY